MDTGMQIGRRNFFRGMAGMAGTAAAGGYAWPAPAQMAGGAVLLDPFPLHKQETPYTCGPASLRMVLEFLGHAVPEKELARAMGTTSTTGTGPWGMNIAANRYLKKFGTGLRARDKIGQAATNDVLFA